MGENGVEEFDAGEALVEDENLVRGVLENGLKYSLLPCARPPNRVEAHMVVNCGSLDETDEEQGIAHLVEHVVFCGTEKLKDSEKVKAAMGSIGMSFGADVNASTDFRSTKYTFHGPIKRPKNLPEMDSDSEISHGFEGVLQMLFEICLRATILESAVTTEKAAVLSELQLRNTVEFRSDKAFFEKFHGDTRLPLRYPIGLEEYVRNFTAADVRRFYDKYYTTTNMELYCVGSFDIPEGEALIKSVFEAQERRPPPVRIAPLLEDTHVYDHLEPERKFATFGHNLLTQVVVSFAVKVRLEPMRTFGDLRMNLIESICCFAFDERMEAIYRGAEHPVFTDVGWSCEGSYREGCAINALSLSCEHGRVREAIAVTVREALRLRRYGILPDEFSRSMHMFLKALKQEAEQAETKQSSSIIADLISENELGDVCLNRRVQYDLFLRASKTIDIDIVNERVKALVRGLGFHEKGDEAKCDPEDMVGCGDCVTFVSGPAGKVLDPKKIQEIVNTALESEIDPPTGIALPPFLFEDVPSSTDFVPVEGAEKKLLKVDDPKRPTEPESGVWFRQLPNGIRCAFHVTENDAKHFDLRINVQGGFASMSDELSAAALSVGMSVLLSGGAAGLESHMISKYVSTHNLDLDLGVGLENVRIEVAAGVADDGLRRAFELVNAFLTSAKWEDSSFERARRERILANAELDLEIERKTAETSFLSFFSGDLRFGTHSNRALRKLTINRVRETVMNALNPSNIEVILVGDFDPEEAEKMFSAYWGNLAVPGDSGNSLQSKPEIKLNKNSNLVKVSVRDSEDRAVVVLTGDLPGRWSISKAHHESVANGSDEKGEPTAVVDQPFSKAMGSRCLVVLSEIINNRLYKEIREEKKLTYWVNFGLTFLDTHDFSVLVVRMSPLADKVEEAIEAVKETMATIAAGEITEDEFNLAISPLITQCESNLKLNSYWLNLCSNLVNPLVPKDASYIVRIQEAYRSLTLKDVKEYGCHLLRDKNYQVTTGHTRPYNTLEDYFSFLPSAVKDLPITSVSVGVACAVIAISATTFLAQLCRKRT